MVRWPRVLRTGQVVRYDWTLNDIYQKFREKWEQMLSTTTIPFELPESRVKIAVKVIDQTGMEHMTVIDDPRLVIRKPQA